MKIKVVRVFRKPTYTIGKLYIDDKFFCDTLEDVDRGINQNMDLKAIEAIKVKHSTAIPTGTYTVNISKVSPRFSNRSWSIKYKGIVPQIENVPGYDGVLIHPGNTEEDTSGCLLVGENKLIGRVINSVPTWEKLMQILTNSKEKIVLTIM